jgi:formylglycine-generating enzyme required for sulfatase activity
MRTLAAVLVLVGSLADSAALADVFNMPSGKSLEFVTVGDPGNLADIRVSSDGSYHGAVAYTYQMGKYDVTAGQYCQFLSAVASVSDPYGLYDLNMDATYNCNTTFGITRSNSSGGYAYAVTGNPNFPVNYVSWGDAARFANWLSNGQPTGGEGAGTTETGSYTLNGATSDASLMAVTRNSGATYAIPSEDEWYKAAYYKGGSTNAGYWLYPTRSNSDPSNVLSGAGTNNANYYDSYGTSSGGYTDPTNILTEVGAFGASPSAYGTFDQGGDVWQWNEANIYGQFRGLRGGSFGSPYYSLQVSIHYYDDASTEDNDRGFRVALVPEPTTLTVLTIGGAAMLVRRRRV